MSNVVVGTLSGHHIFEVWGKISSRMPLEQIVQHAGVICSASVRHKTNFYDTVQAYSPGADMLSML